MTNNPSYPLSSSPYLPLLKYNWHLRCTSSQSFENSSWLLSRYTLGKETTEHDTNRSLYFIQDQLKSKDTNVINKSSWGRRRILLCTHEPSWSVHLPAGMMRSLGVGLPGLPQVHRGPGGGGDGAPATQELADLLDAWTRLLLTQTQSVEVEKCRPAHGLGLVRRRGAAQAAA